MHVRLLGGSLLACSSFACLATIVYLIVNILVACELPTSLAIAITARSRLHPRQTPTKLATTCLPVSYELELPACLPSAYWIAHCLHAWRLPNYWPQQDNADCFCDACNATCTKPTRSSWWRDCGRVSDEAAMLPCSRRSHSVRPFVFSFAA